MENLGDHLLDQTQILNLNLDDQCIFYESFQWWPPSMKDGLKILKVEYHILQILQMKTTSKSGIYLQPLYESCFMSSYGEIIWNLRGILECGSAQPSLLSL